MCRVVSAIYIVRSMCYSNAKRKFDSCLHTMQLTFLVSVFVSLYYRYPIN